jgi:hypothetical protein
MRNTDNKSAQSSEIHGSMSYAYYTRAADSQQQKSEHIIAGNHNHAVVHGSHPWWEYISQLR